MLRSITVVALTVWTATGSAQLPSGTSTSSRESRAPVQVPFSRPPNVLVILCDQLNPRMLSHTDNGFGGVSGPLTPNLDLLAQQGVRFSNANTAGAVCQPARYSLLTGRWPHNHGVRHNNVWEPATEVAFPELARAAGYVTATIGKHHLFWTYQDPPMRDDHGFDVVVEMNDYYAYCAANGQSAFNSPSKTVVMPGLPYPMEATGYTTNSNAFHPAGYWADQVIQFLEARAGPNGDGRPFVCWYSMYGPHTPILPTGVPPHDWGHMYQPYQALALPPNLAKISTTERLSLTQNQYVSISDEQHREMLSYYYGFITQIDWNIGRVLARLDELGLSGDTLVVFTTDHGDMASEMRCWTKGAGSYDAITRVPFIVRLPGTLPADRVVTAPAVNIDLFPTLVEITGVPITETVRTAVDGVSLFDLMTADAIPADWRQEAFHEMGNAKVNRQFMVRTPMAKYTRDELDGAEEFYDLVRDPFEISDLFGDPNPAIQAQIADLQAVFDVWWDDELGHAPIYQQTGPWWVPPLPPTYPVPASGSHGVARDVDPSWRPCTSAWNQEVWFGTESTNLSLLTTLQHMEETFNPGTLDPATIYYWRVDQRNALGVTLGPTWRFTTGSSGSGGPGLATAPQPAHHATDVPLGTTFAWEVGAGTESQDLYFGPAGQLQLAAAALDAGTAGWDPGPLSAGVPYEWRVDGVDVAGTTEGDLWTFTTSPAGLPQRAVGLHPLHLAPAVTIDAVLAWTPGAGATTHDVHFGSTLPLPLQSSQTGAVWDPGLLVSGEVYYWRIDEVNAFGTAVGWTWRFAAE